MRSAIPRQSPDERVGYARLAGYCYDIADAMLAESKKRARAGDETALEVRVVGDVEATVLGTVEIGKAGSVAD